jgi:hypothetical protein
LGSDHAKRLIVHVFTAFRHAKTGLISAFCVSFDLFKGRARIVGAHVQREHSTLLIQPGRCRGKRIDTPALFRVLFIPPADEFS